MTTRSAAQIKASKGNGARSQGPTSQDGKARSAQNSIRHGLCSKEFRLETPEEQAAFDARLEELIFTYRANTELQKDACQQLAIANWRRDVLNNLEAALLQAIAAGQACAMLGGDGLPNLVTINRYRARIARDRKEALAELEELKRKRVEAFKAQVAKAKEFSSLSLLNDLKTDLGDGGFDMFRKNVTNEPKHLTVAPSVPTESKPNRSPVSSRRATKLARKQKHKRK